MKIASGGVQHETNTFSDVPTAIEDFVRDSGCGADFKFGETLFDLYRNTGTIHGGYIQAAEEDSEIELVPLLCTRAQPSGKVTKETFDTLLNLFLDRLKTELPVDAVALDLHGAMVGEEFDDAEGEFISAVRELIGPDIPLVVTLDLHANITQKMSDECDVIIGFDTYPHVDMRERGYEAVQLLARMVRGEVKPVQAFCQLPLIALPPKHCTLRDPMQSVMQKVFAMENEPSVLTATVAMGFPFADIADTGVSVLVTTDNQPELAKTKADELAALLWSVRDELEPELTTVDDVIEFARKNEDGLVIYADGSDNPGGGAPCDGTVVLRRLIEVDFQGAVVGVLFDPETVQQAHEAGVGAVIQAKIGGKTDDRHGSTIETEAYVRTLGDGHFVHQGPMCQGLVGDLGRMAVLVVGGVEVVVSEYRKQLLDSEMIRIVGISPERKKLLVVKSAVHFRADIGPLGSHIFDADTPGIHRPDFSNFEFKVLRRPIYPLDSDVTFP